MDISGLAAALALTFLAGLATAIGSVIAFFAPSRNLRFLSVALGFSAGVMIYVSFVELFPSARAALGDVIEPAPTAAVVALFAGMLGAAVLDRLVPLAYNPHEMRAPGTGPTEAREAERLMQVGLLSALSITLHNLPEGLATFLTSLEDLRLGLPVAIAVGIHNIPEGIAISVPVYYATGSRAQAFVWSALSGLSEPLGALIGLLVFATVWSDLLLGLSLAAVAGIMIFIAFDVLLPAAETHGEHHLAVYALVAGMAVMALSLLLL